jgi:cell division protein FtsB
MSAETEKFADDVFAGIKAYICKRVDPLKAQVRDLSQKLDALSRENAVLAHRLAELEKGG